VPVCQLVAGVSCVEGWCCVLGWCPFYSLGVAVAVCSSSNTMCVDPGVWSLLLWLGYTTLGVVPVVWLSGDAQMRREARRLLIPAACDSETVVMETAMTLDDGSSGSVVSTQLSSVSRTPMTTLN